MTHANFFPNIHFHPILLLFVLIAFMTGMFIELVIILAIVLIHEAGHFFMAKKFRWRVKSIMLWVFGGVMKTDEHGNRPLLEEALVIIAGPFQHVLIFIVVKILQANHILPPSITEIILFYNQIIFFFNLLPIWPLDGGKLLLIVMSYFYPFQKSYHLTIIISMSMSLCLIILQLFFLPFQLSALLLFVFLLLENRTEWRQRYYVFIRFLLSRYKADRSYRKTHPITIPHQASLMEVFTRFYREKKHPIYINFPGQIPYKIDELDCLSYYFSEKKYSETIGELAKRVF